MARPKIQRFIERLALRLPEYRVARGLLYASPVSLLLRGYCFDTSAFEPAAFYVWVFVQPLYVPHDYIFFSFGRRFEEAGAGELRWTLTSANLNTVEEDVLHCIETQGVPLLNLLKDPKDLAKASAREPGSAGELFDCDPDDPNVTEARAYSWILAGNFDKARIDLASLVSDAALRPEQDWEFAIRDRAREVLAVLVRSPEEAKLLLTRWAIDTAKKLRLHV